MLIDHSQLTNIRDKHIGEKVVVCSGCFDMFHYGHLVSLNEAKESGDILVTIILNDKSVSSLKGNKRPVINEQERANIVDNIKAVDYVIISEPSEITDKDIKKYEITNNNKEQLLWSEVTPIILLLKPDIVFTSPSNTKYGSLQRLIEENKMERKDYKNRIPSISTSEIIGKIIND